LSYDYVFNGLLSCKSQSLSEPADLRARIGRIVGAASFRPHRLQNSRHPHTPKFDLNSRIASARAVDVGQRLLLLTISAGMCDSPHHFKHLGSGSTAT
jgi:hypothetical protein